VLVLIWMAVLVAAFLFLRELASPDDCTGLERSFDDPIPNLSRQLLTLEDAGAYNFRRPTSSSTNGRALSRLSLRTRHEQ
jgi:hypothetical protein